MTATRISRTSPTKRRRSKADIAQLKAALYDIIEADRPMTVRQVFYRAVSAGLIAKTEGEYKATICRLLTDMRRVGELPFSWIADNTRWMRKPNTYDGLEDVLYATAQFYRRSIWKSQPCYCEVWLEKDALSGVLYRETEEWDVPLMVTRGYPSLTFIHAAADAIARQGKPVHLFYFGDHDPSGLDIPRMVEEVIREFAPDADVHFERVAVTPQQIIELDLPTRPTKKSDSRAKGFEGKSVEVDAIAPNVLRRMVRQRIEALIDPMELDVLKVAEESERAYLERLAELDHDPDAGPADGEVI